MIAIWYSVSGQQVEDQPTISFEQGLTFDDCIQQACTQHDLGILIRKDNKAWAYLGSENKRLLIARN